MQPVNRNRSVDTMATTGPESVRIELGEIYRRLERRIQEAGSLRTAAAAMKVSPQYLSAVLKGHKKPGPALLEAFGITQRRITVYTIQRAA